MSSLWSEVGKGYLRFWGLSSAGILGIVGQALSIGQYAEWAKAVPPVGWALLWVVGLFLPLFLTCKRLFNERNSALEEKAKLAASLAEHDGQLSLELTRTIHLLRFGGHSPLRPDLQIDEANRAFDALVAATNGGDIASAKALISFAPDFIAILRDYSGGGSDVTRAVQRVTDAAEQAKKKLDNRALTPVLP